MNVTCVPIPYINIHMYFVLLLKNQDGHLGVDCVVSWRKKTFTFAYKLKPVIANNVNMLA